MEYLAYHDSLTGLPNRTMFREHLDLALERARRHDLAVAVLNVDLDDFKLINDSFGHDMGDELLRQAAERLRRVTRSTDLVARHGGDEFLILLTDLPRERINGDAGAAELTKTIAGHIERDLHEPFRLGDSPVYAGGSIGCSIFPQDADAPEALLAHADLAMYQSKRASHGIQQPYPEDRSGAQHRVSLTAGLHKALENDEFVLHYQPIVDLAGGRIVGAEGLIRWQHPTDGLIPPNSFIPLAERSGLIHGVTNWVVRQALCDAKIWADAGIKIKTGVNVPLTHLQPSAVARLLDEIDDAGVDPGLFTIEVTESATMTNPEHTQQQLHRLRSRGVNLAIDDFGTGYSSLARLTQMPVTTLKIDRAFIRQVPHNESATAVAKTIIELSHSLGAQPLAEGVETPEQLDFLVQHGCRLGQGYLFSQPVAAHHIPGLQETFSLNTHD
jgi:diguanylate cyclase (GGDEF)-like protein